MRLLNTESYTFKEFFDSDIPAYAILSHRWGDDEITLQEFRKGKHRDTQGYVKVEWFCALAEEEGFAWVWVDTCCIDKKSSAELSEAINSMYSWYKKAKVCYVYLSDIAWNDRDIESSKALFTQSSWFTRGWTLQELIAPEKVLFFDSEWNCFGTKTSLSELISAATGMEKTHMYDFSVHSSSIHESPRTCIAQKMSWMSKRKTSRSEDMSYCMLGLFDVNMPLLYGEGGAKAFMRLQLEIIKQSDDESIFAWTLPEQAVFASFGLLAPWPTCFANSGNIEAFRAPSKERFPYQMTNQGLRFEVPVAAIQGQKPISNTKEKEDPAELNRLSFVLNCWRKVDKKFFAITIELKKLAASWHRVSCKELILSRIVQDSVEESENGAVTINIVVPRIKFGDVELLFP